MIKIKIVTLEELNKHYKAGVTARDLYEETGINDDICSAYLQGHYIKQEEDDEED